MAMTLVRSSTAIFQLSICRGINGIKILKNYHGRSKHFSREKNEKATSPSQVIQLMHKITNTIAV